MATLWVCEGYEKAFNRKISAYTNKLEDIQAQYTNAMSYVGSYTSDSQVNNTCIYLKKRKKALQSSIDEAEALKKRVNSYAQVVLSADRTVADSVHKKAYTFYQKKGIGPQSDTGRGRTEYTIRTTVEDFFHDALGTAAKIVDGIHEFYEEYKYLINIGLDLVKIAAATALFTAVTLTTGPLGFACMVGATWAMSKAVYDTATDTLAAAAWMNGDLETAEMLSDSTLTGLIILGGELLDEALGTPQVFKSTAKILTFGFEACQFTASMVCIFDKFKDTFNLKKRIGKNKNLCCTDLKNSAGLTWKESAAAWKKTDFFHKTRLCSPSNWANFAMSSVGFSVKIDVGNLPEKAKFFSDNMDVLRAYKEKGGKAFWDLNPIAKAGGKFRTAIEEIIME